MCWWVLNVLRVVGGMVVICVVIIMCWKLLRVSVFGYFVCLVSVWMNVVVGCCMVGLYELGLLFLFVCGCFV